MTESLIDGGRKMHGEKKDLDFGKRAHKYDGSWGRILSRFYRLLLKQVKLSPDMTILDVGCGTGIMLRKMADSCPIIGYGIDMEENMIKEAQHKCPEMNIQISRCEETPFEDNTFDTIIACLAYHHFSDREGFAKESARILKPGGSLYIADPHYPKIIRKLMNAFFNHRRIAGGFYTPDEIFEDLAAFGFEPDGYVFDGLAQVVKLKLV